MRYIWTGRKPHRHYHIVLGTTGKERGKPIQMHDILIQPGESFEPSAAEILAFRDLMTPVGAGLRAETADAAPQEAARALDDAPALETEPLRTSTGRFRSREEGQE